MQAHHDGVPACFVWLGFGDFAPFIEPIICSAPAMCGEAWEVISFCIIGFVFLFDVPFPDLSCGHGVSPCVAGGYCGLCPPLRAAGVVLCCVLNLLRVTACAL